MQLIRLMPLVITGALMVAACNASTPGMTTPGCGTPAGGTFQGGQNLGGYWGQTLPGTFAQLKSEAEVDAAITRASQGGEWNCFQQFYGGAVAKWRENTKK